jgi:hypothetical protein
MFASAFDWHFDLLNGAWRGEVPNPIAAAHQPAISASGKNRRNSCNLYSPNEQ